MHQYSWLNNISFDIKLKVKLQFYSFVKFYSEHNWNYSTHCLLILLVFVKFYEYKWNYSTHSFSIVLAFVKYYNDYKWNHKTHSFVFQLYIHSYHDASSYPGSPQSLPW